MQRQFDIDQATVNDSAGDDIRGTPGGEARATRDIQWQQLRQQRQHQPQRQQNLLVARNRFLESAGRLCCCSCCFRCSRLGAATSERPPCDCDAAALLAMSSGATAAAAASRWCRPVSLAVLAQRTRFTREQLKLMYRGFKNECPSGIVHREAFREIFCQFFPLGDASGYADLVFNSFDRGMRGWLTFEAVIEGLSVICKGTTVEKLDWVFRLYDADGDGVISKEEMTQLVTSIYDMLGCCVSPRVTQVDPREHAERIFHAMDADRDGWVTFQEFVRACQLGERDLDRELACFDTLL